MPPPSNYRNNGGNFIARLRAGINAAMMQAGEDIGEDIRADLSVPVEYQRGPRGGLRIIRSKPGEPPRMETGELRASVAHAVEDPAGEPVVLHVYDAMEYGPHLEFGTSRMLPRPEWRQAAMKWARPVARRCALHVRNALSR